MQSERLIEADVIVVGAGLAGLAAARDLEAAGLTVAVLEARERVGGRIKPYDLGGETVDLGGEYFGDRSTAIAQLAESLGIRRFRSHDEGDRITYIDGRQVRYRKLVPPVGPLVLADFTQAVARIERRLRTLPPDSPWTARHARRWDSQTMFSWCRENMVTAGARDLFALGVEAALCASPRDLSLLHVLSYAKASGGFLYLFGVRGGIQEFRFEGGAAGIPARLAASLHGDVHLGAVVRRVQTAGDRVTVSGIGFRATGRRALLALPTTLAGRLEYDPPLPGYRDQLTQRVSAGAAIKCLAIYDEPFWREQGLSGQATRLGGPVRVAFDTSPKGGRPGVLSAFVVGTAAREMTRLPAPQRRVAVLAELTRSFGRRAGRPAAFVEQNWMDAAFTRGCYHGFAPPGMYTSYGPALRRPIGVLHWAGTETGVHQMGSMGGAVDSGRRAAREIVGVLGDRGSRRPPQAAHRRNGGAAAGEPVGRL